MPKLKEATAKIRNLRISPDRSLNEREDVLNLVTKVKNLNDQEEGNFVDADTKIKEERRTRKLNFWYTNIDTLTKTKY